MGSVPTISDKRGSPVLILSLTSLFTHYDRPNQPVTAALG